MGLNDVHWAWIAGELVLFNFVGIYVLVADQWDKAIILRCWQEQSADGGAAAAGS